MTARARPRLVAIAVALGTLVALAAPSPVGAAGGERPESGRLYRSRGGADPSVRLLAIGARPDGRRLVAVRARFDCNDLELDGTVLATVTPQGAFRARSGAFSLTGGGTDSVDAEVEVQGRFRGRKVEGTITSEAEAFDNAGTTGTCDDEVGWSARAGGSNPSLERIDASVALGRGFAVVAAGPDAAYVATAPDTGDEARVHRINAATDEVAWEVEVGTEVSALAATADAVWVVTGAGAGVLRLDAATGEQVAGVTLDGDSAGAFSPATGIAATDTAVWVAAEDLYRVDPATNTLAGTVDLGDDAEDSVLALDADALYVGVNRARGDDDADGPPHRLLRVDPGTNAVVTEAEGVGHFAALAASDGVLWAAPFFDPVQVLDATTLHEVATVDVETEALVAAPPGAWVLTGRGVAAHDATDSDEPAVRIPVLGGDFGSIAAYADVVWVWDPRLGTLTRLAAG